MAMASALRLSLLAPRAVSISASAGRAARHLLSRRLALRLPPSPPRPAALSAASAVRPREAARVQPLRAASFCGGPAPAAGPTGGGAKDWRAFLAW
jgi:peroxisomal membrane protein 2